MGKNGKQIDYVFLDSCFDKEDPEEKRCFDQAMDKLLNALNAANDLPTSKVQEVATEKAALRREIAEKESAAKAAEERLIQLAKGHEEDAKKLADHEKQLHQANLHTEKAKVLEKDKEIEQAKLAGEKEKAKSLEAEKNAQNVKLEAEKAKAKALEAQLDQVRVKQEETIRNHGREISELNRKLQDGGRPKQPENIVSHLFSGRWF